MVQTFTAAFAVAQVPGKRYLRLLFSKGYVCILIPSFGLTTYVFNEVLDSEAPRNEAQRVSLNSDPRESPYISLPYSQFPLGFPYAAKLKTKCLEASESRIEARTHYCDRTPPYTCTF